MKHIIASILLISIFCFANQNKIEITKESKITVFSNYF